MLLNISIKNHHVLDKDLQNCIESFFVERNWKGLYLTGGTCIAEYYFGHRLSIDMDIFTPDPELFQDARRLLMREDFFPFGKLSTRRSLPDFSEFLLTRENKDPIKIDLVLDIPISLGEKIQFGDVWLDSLPDLVANKLGCLIQRNEIKDYLDLYYLLPAINLSPVQLIELGQKKDAGLDPLVLAHQIQYIQSIPQTPSIFLPNLAWKQVQDFFEKFHDELLEGLF